MTTVQDLQDVAGTEPITMLTAYDTPTAELVDDAGIDVILVGDSMGNAALGYETTLPVTLEEMASHTGAVVRGVEEALVVADMPFLTYGVDEPTTIQNCGRMLKTEGADAVKLESGPHTVDLTERLVSLGIPVMAHLGLTPQHVNQLGGYRRQGTDTESSKRILELAQQHEQAGAFSLVLEHVPANLATRVTESVDIPTIGIGAGPNCDGQVLVLTDVVGLSEKSPPFARSFGDVRSEYRRAIESYKAAVEAGEFPGEDHSHTAEHIEDRS